MEWCKGMNRYFLTIHCWVRGINDKLIKIDHLRIFEVICLVAELVYKKYQNDPLKNMSEFSS